MIEQDDVEVTVAVSGKVLAPSILPGVIAHPSAITKVAATVEGFYTKTRGSFRSGGTQRVVLMASSTEMPTYSEGIELLVRLHCEGEMVEGRE